MMKLLIIYLIGVLVMYLMTTLLIKNHTASDMIDRSVTLRQMWWSWIGVIFLIVIFGEQFEDIITNWWNNR